MAPPAARPLPTPPRRGPLRWPLRWPTRWPLRWPLPALLAWLLAWGLHAGLLQLGVARAPALLLAACGPALAAMLAPGLSGWRRLFVAAGFPLSALLSGAATGLPAWAWLLPLGLLLAAYPLRAWRDAPLFPTPAAALHGLADMLQLPPGARVLDAGCGLGHGLLALRAAWPGAQIEGIEWSPALAWAARLRCRFARVRRGDMWAAPWTGCDVVYLYQRPESMARAWQKAQAELAPRAWLVSLEFVVPGQAPSGQLQAPGQPPVWLYRVGGDSIPQALRR